MSICPRVNSDGRIAYNSRLGGFTVIDLAKMRARGEGVQNPKNFADVLYVWSPTTVKVDYNERLTECKQQAQVINLFQIITKRPIRKSDLCVPETDKRLCISIPLSGADVGNPQRLLPLPPPPLKVTAKCLMRWKLRERTTTMRWHGGGNRPQCVRGRCSGKKVPGMRGCSHACRGVPYTKRQNEL